MIRKRYELNWHDRTITVYVDGSFSHVVKFTQALAFQRNIIAKAVLGR